MSLLEDEVHSSGAMDFSEYNSVSAFHRPPSRAEQMRLEGAEKPYMSSNEPKVVNTVSVYLEGMSATVEKRREVESPVVKTEPQEDRSVLEGSPGEAGGHELEKCLKEPQEIKGGITEQRTSLKKGMEKTEPDFERENEERSSNSEEMPESMSMEVTKAGQEVEGPFEIPMELHPGELKVAKRKKSKASEAPEDASSSSRGNMKSRAKGMAKKTVAKRLSRKRKAMDDGGCNKKPKKEEGGEEEGNRWKWWEEEKRKDGVKWLQLEHNGPYFAPAYERLPDYVSFYYDGKPMKLSQAAEEVATFFAKMLDHEYTSKKVFQNNFFNDWTEAMTAEERTKIKHLKKCNFKEIHQYFVDKHESQKSLSKEEKQQLKDQAERIQQEFGYCTIDGHREKIGNFKMEPPGLFRGRGEHPKMGKLKKRINPEDVIINCSRDSKIPKPPSGHKWKEVRFDNSVTWLASWTENIQGAIKYIMLNPSSKLKGEKDWQKYEVARRLKGVVDKIRSQYQDDWKSKDRKDQQRSVALYLIDKLALRAGNEKEEGESADTVGCCSLRVEHITLYPRLDGKVNVVEFDFLGKDCVRYYNQVPVPKQVFKNLQTFVECKDPGDGLFDRLTTTSLNKHLQDLMDGLTAKVFRTYNASITLQEQLDALTNDDDNVAAKLLSYNRANRAVAVLCNHQRATPKTYEKSMEKLQQKIDTKKQQLVDAEMELRRAKADHRAKKSVKSKAAVEKKQRLMEKIETQLETLTVQATDKEESKQIALGTSKLNYLDPRISVAWCKRFEVPIEKIYSKTQREKFAWAIAMADKDFQF